MRRYDIYKDSGIEWLESLPSSWSTRRIKDIASVISKGTTPSTEGEAYTDFGVRYIKAENINENGKVTEVPVFYISETTNKLLARSILKANDLLIVIAGATTGKVAVLKTEQLPANTNQAVCFIRLHNSEKSNLQYKYYFLNSSFLQSQVWLYAVTSAQPNLPMAVLSRFNICYPPIKEQTAIAQYLDTKTQAIDKKISLLVKKIGYYKELRKSIINETVTKGLDKNVKLKDSGIDWIGQIPEHWEVKRFKSFADTIKGKNLEYFDNYFEGALPNLSLEYLRNDNVVFDTFVSTTSKSLIVDENDIIIIWDGAGVGEILKAKTGVISSTIAKLKFHKSFSSKYFYHLRNNLEYTLKQIPTGMGIPHLNPHILKNYMCPVPPLSEQTEIATYLDHKTQTIDKIVGNIQNQITTLKELRKTLINDVVTGKIKVVA